MDATLSCTRADIQSQPQHKSYPPLGNVSGKLLPTCQLTAICVFFRLSLLFILFSFLCVLHLLTAPLFLSSSYLPLHLTCLPLVA